MTATVDTLADVIKLSLPRALQLSQLPRMQLMPPSAARRRLNCSAPLSRKYRVCLWFDRHSAARCSHELHWQSIGAGSRQRADLANVPYTAGITVTIQPNTSGPAGGLLRFGSANIALLGQLYRFDVCGQQRRTRWDDGRRGSDEPAAHAGSASPFMIRLARFRTDQRARRDQTNRRRSGADRREKAPATTAGAKSRSWKACGDDPHEPYSGRS